MMEKAPRKMIIIFISLMCFVLAFYISVQPRNLKTLDLEQNWLDVQQQRKAILNYTCTKFKLYRHDGILDPSVAKMLYVEHNHKFIYCEVPKVGCTSWKRILLLLTMNISRDFSELPQESVHTARMYTKLSSYSPNKQRQLLNNYTKVMFSRQPFERLVSAYRDKFHRNRTDDYYIKSIAGFIKSKFRKSNESEGPLTFIEFVRFILQEPPKHSDIHWRPMSLLCDPCNIRYDIIGKFENLKQDSNHVLMDIGAPKDFYYPHIREHATDTGEEASKSYFRNLSSDHLQGLVSRYYLDFKLFGYPVF